MLLLILSIKIIVPGWKEEIDIPTELLFAILLMP
jgi:hypothetical protein